MISPYSQSARSCYQTLSASMSLTEESLNFFLYYRQPFMTWFISSFPNPASITTCSALYILVILNYSVSYKHLYVFAWNIDSAWNIFLLLFTLFNLIHPEDLFQCDLLDLPYISAELYYDDHRLEKTWDFSSIVL